MNHAVDSKKEYIESNRVINTSNFKKTTGASHQNDCYWSFQKLNV